MSNSKLNIQNQEIANTYINLYNEVEKLRKDNASEYVVCSKLEEMDDVMCEMDQSTADYVEGVLGEFCFC